MEEEELTYIIRGCVFEVFRGLGAGFLEQVYQRALIHELSAANLKVESQKKIAVRYKGIVVGEYVADILVEERVLLELKAVAQFLPVHEAQLLNYLKATGIKVGLLINFTYPKAQINVYNPRSAVIRKDEYRDTLVKRGATLGANSTIVCGVTIGEHAFVAAGAVVNRDVKPFALMAGVPAYQIGWISRHGERLDLSLQG